jgi:cytoskeletal protein CcmA (bactofilin family)
MAFWKRGSENPVDSTVSDPNAVGFKPTEHSVNKDNGLNRSEQYGTNTLGSSSEDARLDPLEEDLLRRFGRIRSALSPGTTIQGKLSFDTPVRIDGKLAGDIFSSQVLLVGRGAEVVAEVEADIVVILGSVKGSIKAKSRIEILSGAKVEATLNAPILILQDGASYTGKCSIKNRA